MFWTHYDRLGAKIKKIFKAVLKLDETILNNFTK